MTLPVLVAIEHFDFVELLGSTNMNDENNIEQHKEDDMILKNENK